MEQCTERYKAMRMVLGLTLMFGNIIAKILPAPLNTVGGLVIQAMEYVQKLLIPVNQAVDGFYELRMKIFEPIDTLAHIMSDVTAFADILLKIASMNSITKMIVETILKKTYINKVFAILTKFTMIAIKLVFENPVVKAIGQAPMKACSAAMYVLTENPIYRLFIRAGKNLQSGLSKKFTIMGKSFSVQWILRKLTAAMDLVIGKIMALLDPIIKPLKTLFNEKVKPLFMTVLKKFGFPAGDLPGGKEPGFMKKDSVLGPGCYMRVWEPCVGDHKWKVRHWNKVEHTNGAEMTAKNCLDDKKKEWLEKCKVKKIFPKFVPGKPEKDPPVNPFWQYHTCAFNIDYFMKSGMNRCHCCIMGMMNPKKPVASLLLFALKSKICKLMRPSAPSKKQLSEAGKSKAKLVEQLKLSKVELSPIPSVCWSPTVADRQKAEAEALKKLDEASTNEPDMDAKDLGKGQSNITNETIKEVMTPELAAEEKKAEKVFAAAEAKGGVPEEMETNKVEDKEVEKEEKEEQDGASEACADEGKNCACRGTVFYGKKFVDGSKESNILTLKKFPFAKKEVTQSIECSKAGFGEDPIEGSQKHCICIEETPGEADRAEHKAKEEDAKTLEKANVEVDKVKDDPVEQKDGTVPAENKKMFLKGYTKGTSAGVEYCKEKAKGKLEAAASTLDLAMELAEQQVLRRDELGEKDENVVKEGFRHGFREQVESCKAFKKDPDQAKEGAPKKDP